MGYMRNQYNTFLIILVKKQKPLSDFLKGVFKLSIKKQFLKPQMAQ